jgi:uncharacterized surface anchored protein
MVHKIDAVTGESLTGAKFRITKMNGEFLGEYTTERGGVIHISDLEDGFISIVEIKSPAGYVLDASPKVVEIKGKSAFVEFENSPMSSLQIKKVDDITGDVISGAEFEITKINGEYVGHYTTNRYGMIAVPELEDGWYIVAETRAAKGYKCYSPAGSGVRDQEIRKAGLHTCRLQSANLR